MSISTLKTKVEQLINKVKKYNMLRNEFIEPYEGGYKLIPYCFYYSTIEKEREIEELLDVDLGKIYYIDEKAFQHSNIGSLSLPAVRMVGGAAFNQCTELVSVDLPVVSEVLGAAFSGATKLSQVNMPNLIKVGATAFYKVPTKTLYFPNLVSLGTQAISMSSVENLTLGALHTTSISSFANCDTLTNLVVGQGTSAALYIQHSTKYTQETLHAIIDNLYDWSNDESRVFRVGEENLAKISVEYLAKLDAKNWDYS